MFNRISIHNLLFQLILLWYFDLIHFFNLSFFQTWTFYFCSFGFVCLWFFCFLFCWNDHLSSQFILNNKHTFLNCPFILWFVFECANVINFYLYLGKWTLQESHRMILLGQSLSDPRLRPYWHQVYWWHYRVMVLLTLPNLYWKIFNHVLVFMHRFPKMVYY